MRLTLRTPEKIEGEHVAKNLGEVGIGVWFSDLDAGRVQITCALQSRFDEVRQRCSALGCTIIEENGKREIGKAGQNPLERFEEVLAMHNKTRN